MVIDELCSKVLDPSRRISCSGKSRDSDFWMNWNTLTLTQIVTVSRPAREERSSSAPEFGVKEVASRTVLSTFRLRLKEGSNNSSSISAVQDKNSD